MQVPKRKPGKYTNERKDTHVTEEKLRELKKELENLKKIQPGAADEVRRLSEMGDFSENAAYQMAKGRLRGINDRIFEISEYLKHVIIIEPNESVDTVQIGHTVTIEMSGKNFTYLILGSSETDPDKGVISHNSPLGSILMDHKVGDSVTLKQKDREVTCRILKIE